MTPLQAAALANSVAHLNILYLLVSIFVIAGAAAVLTILGERALGIDLRRFNDNIEKLADAGDVWPGVVAFCITPATLLGIVLWVALR